MSFDDSYSLNGSSCRVIVEGNRNFWLFGKKRYQPMRTGAYSLDSYVLIDEKRRFVEQLRISKKVRYNASLDQFM